MLKKRLIFTLLYRDGDFYLSRNYRLQRVGGVDWLEANYKFSDVAKSIDELVIIDLSRESSEKDIFCRVVSRITKDIFIPLVLGGRIRSVQDVDLLVRNGADKVIINTLISENQNVIRELVEIYGSQCIVASVDYRIIDSDVFLYSEQGKKQLEYTLEEYLALLEELGVGEIFLNSIDRDGTGQGYTLDIAERVVKVMRLPVVLAGGAGNQYHFEEGLIIRGVDGVSTANLFNFIGNGLPEARKYLLSKSIDLSIW